MKRRMDVWRCGMLCLLGFTWPVAAQRELASVGFHEEMAVEMLDEVDFGVWAEQQRRWFNLITPPTEYSWIQPVGGFPLPFGTERFSDDFLNGLSGVERSSVPVYPVSLTGNGTEWTIWNRYGEAISRIPAASKGKIISEMEWPEGMNPARVILAAELIEREDMELFLDVQAAEKALMQSDRMEKEGAQPMRGGANGTAFRFLSIHVRTNGIELVVTNATTNLVEFFVAPIPHAVAPTVITNWVDEFGIPVPGGSETSTNLTPVIITNAAGKALYGRAFKGLESEWVYLGRTNVLNSGATWLDTARAPNELIGYYAAAEVADSDGDDLSDAMEELIYRTNPDLWDTDGDGLGDGEEVLTYETDPLAADSDGDGLSDYDEIHIHGTDPNNADTDGDGMSDGWEVTYGFNPLADEDGTLGDPDCDGIPNIYEQANGGHPLIADASTIQKTRVSSTAALRAALNEAIPYQIIELADGMYTLPGTLVLPEVPVMLTSDNLGKSKKTILHSSHAMGMLLLCETNPYTVIRGLTLRLTGKTGRQYGVFMATGLPWITETGGGALLDGLTLELDNPNSVGVFVRGRRTKPLILNNLVFQARRTGDGLTVGLDIVDGGEVHVVNPTFTQFATDSTAVGLLVESSIYGDPLEPGRVIVRNALFDETFASTNALPMARVEYGPSVNVIFTNCLMPTNANLLAYTPDSLTATHWADVSLALGGFQPSNAPSRGRGGTVYGCTDLEGEFRVALDIGADEYYTKPALQDSDGDGIPDILEIELYGTNPYQTDSDHDGIPDNLELIAGTSPRDSGSYRFTVQGSITNQTGVTTPVYAGLTFGAEWDGNHALLITSNAYSFTVTASNDYLAPFIHIYCDFNSNGVHDAGIEPLYSQEIVVINELLMVNFLLKNCDGDFATDYEEFLDGTNPNNPNDYKLFLTASIPDTECYLSADYRMGFSKTTSASGWIYDVPVTTNWAFEFLEYRETQYQSRYYAFIYEDINRNGMYDPLDGWLVAQVIVPPIRSYEIILNAYYLDRDSDYMNDFWEVRVGLDPTAVDDYWDPDDDALLNIHEYYAQTDPFTSDPFQYALQDANASVDTLLAGKTPAVAWPIFSVRNHTTTNYIRNTNCWAYPYDLSGVSVWTDAIYLNVARPNGFTATLISPCHVVWAKHWSHVPIGGTLRFVDMNNQIEERTVIAKTNHATADLTIGLLDAELPTNCFKVYKILPDDYQEYIYSGYRLPSLFLNQTKRAMVGELAGFGLTTLTHNRPGNTPRNQFYENVVGGDSSNPAFMVLNGEPILLNVWWHGAPGPGDGSCMVYYKNDINQMMNALGGGYQLMEINLSIYRKLRNK